MIGRKDGVRIASAVLEIISKDEKKRIRYENELIFDLDQRSRINGAIKERDIEIAWNPLRLGVPKEKISMATCLTAKELDGLMV